MQGTIGGTETLNGKKIYGYNSNNGNGVGHTFAIPTLGISVPLIGNLGNATTVCGGSVLRSNAATTSSGSPSSPRARVSIPWQCFVPCGLGFLYGNGGPMSTVGYMGGFLEVVS